MALSIILPFLALYVLWRTDPRYLIGVSLVLLVSAAAEDALGNAPAANDIAIVFYYCLVAGVVLMIADSYLEKHRGGRLSAFASGVRGRLYSLRGTGLMRYVPSVLPFLVFAAITLLILQPFLSSGYVLVTDMVFGPLVPTGGLYGLQTSLGGGSALTAFEYALSLAVPVWAVQKMFLFLIFFLSGASMYALAGKRMGPARYYASILYMVNPFIYARMLAGAWALMFAYAVAPLALLAFIRLLGDGGVRGRGLRSAFWAASLFTLVVAFDTHTFAWLTVLCLLYFAVSLIFEYRRPVDYLKKTAIPLAMFVVMLVAFNVFWLITSGSSSGTILGGFTFLDAIAFASQPTVLNNTMFSIAAMYGFFRTGYLYPVTFYPELILLFVMFLFLAVFGFVSNWNNRKRGPLTVTLGIGAVASVILATGISSPLTSGIYTYLFNNVPFFNGFREPQKLVAVVVMAYSYLGALGIHEFEKYLRSGEQVKRSPVWRRTAEVGAAVVIAVALISPFAYSYMEINGFNGQLSNVQYPASWYSAEGIMAQNTSDYSVLVFPWHTYMYYNWSQTKFASPFNQFFKQNLVFGGSDTYVGGEEAFQTGTAGLISQVLQYRNNITHLGNIMSLFDAKYVFLSKSGDYGNYSFLYRQADLSLVYNTTECALFVNDHAVSRAYLVQQVMHVSSYSEIINLSASVNLMDYAWVQGGQGGMQINSTFTPVQTNENSRVSYTAQLPGILGFGASDYLVFIPPEGAVGSWKAGGNLLSYYAQNNLPAGNALYTIYSVGGGPGSITFTFTPYRSLQYAYAVSAVSFALAAILTLLSFYPAEFEKLRNRTVEIFRKRNV